MEDPRDFSPDELLDRAVDAVLRGSIPDELPPDRVVQLAAVVRHAADESYPITLTERIKNMKPRTRIAVAAAVLVAFVGLMSWLAPGGTALAFTNVAEALTNVQSARWKTTTVIKRPEGKVETTHEIGMFLAPSRERTETPVAGVPGGQSIRIFEGRKALLLNPMRKQATALDVKVNIEGLPQEAGPFGTTFLDLRQTVAAAQSGELKKAEPLGIQVVDGRRATGFRIKRRSGETRIWVDPKTSLPIRVERAGTSGKTEVHTVMTDFEINPDLDESLFSLDVPEGYTLLDTLQFEIPTPLIFLAEALGMSAELNGGVFPSSLLGEQGLLETLPRVGPAYLEKKYGKDLDAYMKEKFGKDLAEMSEAARDKSELMEEMSKSGMLEELSEMRKEALRLPAATAGATALLRSLSPKHDWHYAGKDVKLNTPNRPIFWMKAWMKGPKKGGKYEVIYADLSVKEIEPEDVPKVPASEGSPKE